MKYPFDSCIFDFDSFLFYILSIPHCVPVEVAMTWVSEIQFCQKLNAERHQYFFQ